VGEAPTVSLDAEEVRPEAPDAELASCWRSDAEVPAAPASCASSIPRAFAAGCATSITFDHVGAFQGTTKAAAEGCLRAHIVGMRWDCMVPDGWAHFRIASCTLE
jgi:hypothetical protein